MKTRKIDKKVFGMALGMLIAFRMTMTPLSATQLGPPDLVRSESSADTIAVGRVIQNRLENPLSVRVTVDRVLKGNDELKSRSLTLGVDDAAVKEQGLSQGAYGVMFLSKKDGEHYGIMLIGNSLDEYLLPALPQTPQITRPSKAPLGAVVEELAAVLAASPATLKENGMDASNTYPRILRALTYVPYAEVGPTLSAIISSPGCDPKGRLFANYLLILKDDWSCLDSVKEILLNPPLELLNDVRAISSQMSPSIRRKGIKRLEWKRQLPSELELMTDLQSSTDYQVRSDATLGLSQVKQTDHVFWQQWSNTHHPKSTN